MRELHVVANLSTAGALKQALDARGRDEAITHFPDNLSYGPIFLESDYITGRWKWWRWDFLGSPESHATQVQGFWRQMSANDHHPVIWWGRHSPSECAFFMALVDRLATRPIGVIDVTGTQYTFVGPNGQSILSQPADNVSAIRSEGLEHLLGKQTPLEATQKEQATANWRKLRLENAPLRILSSSGLVSAPIDHFDAYILKHLKPEWCLIQKVLLNIFTDQLRYRQLNGGMMLMRINAMIQDGRIEATEEPLNSRTSHVRLAKHYIASSL